jgi:hypothetical protein
VSVNTQRGSEASPSSRVDRLDVSLFSQIKGACASSSDRRSLLALHAALATRGEFSYLEIGSYHGASLQSFIADPRCCAVVSVDRRDASSPDERPEEAEYPDNTTAGMLERLARVPSADLRKLTAIEASTEELDPVQLNADLCLIDAEHTNAAALRDARFCFRAIRGRGWIVFHDRILVDRGIRRFIGELERYRAYPLAHDLFVVEIGVPTLLSDERVRAQLPHRIWELAYRMRMMRIALGLAPVLRSLRRAFARSALTLGAPRRARPGPYSSVGLREVTFEIHTFVDDERLYERMRDSFIEAGFASDAFIRHTDAVEDPYAAITRIGGASTARYPILCHQDVFADQGAGVEQLTSLLQHLDGIDPSWVVAGNAGVMRSGRLIRRLVDGHGGSTGEDLPLPVVTLDEDFLVFNPRGRARCSAGVSGFHLYGADVCLHALAAGGSAYVIDFPVTHIGRGTMSTFDPGVYWSGYRRAKQSFIAAWNQRCAFRYVITPSDAMFVSRSKLLRRVFGSQWVVGAVAQCRYEGHGSELRSIDRIFASRAKVRERIRTPR